MIKKLLIILFIIVTTSFVAKPTLAAVSFDSIAFELFKNRFGVNFLNQCRENNNERLKDESDICFIRFINLIYTNASVEIIKQNKTLFGNDPVGYLDYFFNGFESITGKNYIEFFEFLRKSYPSGVQLVNICNGYTGSRNELNLCINIIDTSLKSSPHPVKITNGYATKQTQQQIQQSIGAVDISNVSATTDTFKKIATAVNCGQNAICSPQCLNQMFAQLAEKHKNAPSPEKFISPNLRGFIIGSYSAIDGSDKPQRYLDDIWKILNNDSIDPSENNDADNIANYDAIVQKLASNPDEFWNSPFGKEISKHFQTYVIFKYFLKTDEGGSVFKCDPDVILSQENMRIYSNSLKNWCNNYMGRDCKESIEKLIPTVKNLYCIGYIDKTGASFIDDTYIREARKPICGYADGSGQFSAPICCTEEAVVAEEQKRDYCKRLVCSDKNYKNTTYCSNLTNDQIFSEQALKYISADQRSILNDAKGNYQRACIRGIPVDENKIPYATKANGELIGADASKCTCADPTGYALCGKYVLGNGVVSGEGKNLSQYTKAFFNQYAEKIIIKATVDADNRNKNQQPTIDDIQNATNYYMNFYLQENNTEAAKRSLNKDKAKLYTLIKGKENEYNKCLDCFIDEGGHWSGLGCIPNDAPKLSALIFSIGLAAAGFIALLNIIISAIQIQTLGSQPKQLEDARKRITNSILALLLIIFSIVILRFIGITLFGFTNIFR